MSTETSNRAALDGAVSARKALQAHRRNYHLALLIARNAGWSDEELADALGTSPLYVGNAIRRHRAGECGCEVRP
jgi:hypothetical protein